MPPDDSRHGATRMLPLLLLTLAAMLLLARIVAGIHEWRHPPQEMEWVKWRPLEAAGAQAQSSGMPILYDFSAEWCGPCQRMQQEVFADRQSAQLINSTFVPVRVVDRQREEGRNPTAVAALEERYKVGAFPTLVVVPLDGSPPTVIEGYPGKRGLIQQLTQAGVKARLSRGLVR